MKRTILFFTLVAAFFITASVSAEPAGITDGLVLWLDASEIHSEEDQDTPPDSQYETRLIGAYPNPFNPGTNIRFELERSATVSVIIYNILGQQIRYLTESFEAGDNTLYWDGNDSNGNTCQSGVFFYRFLTSIGYEQYDKMILTK